MRSAIRTESLPLPEGWNGGRVSHLETCLFWRCARCVLDQGHPALDTVIVELPFADGTKFPLLGATLTRDERLICWPVLPERVCAAEDRDQLELTDHVTLELRNRRSHSTAYDELGQAKHPRKWPMISFPDASVSLWFGFAIRLSAIREQVLQLDQWRCMPAKDRDRRVTEYNKFFAGLRFVDARIPAGCGPRCDSLVVFVYVVDGPEVKLSQPLLQPLNQWPNEFWEQPPEDRRSSVCSTRFAVGNAQLGLLIGYAPCNLREDGPVLFTPHQG